MTVDQLAISIAKQIENKFPEKPMIGCILGSGLGDFANTLTNKIKIPTSEIHDYPKTSVVGHAGELIFGYAGKIPVLVFKGRIHLYEGHDISLTALPIWILNVLGIKKVIITNAAGGLNKQFRVGDLMLITDHINWSGKNPLIGKNPEGYGPRFPDMSEPYATVLQNMAEKTALTQKLYLQKGVYLFTTGPSYETPAEISAFQRMGADAVGMSTVPEVIIANYLSMQVVAFSLITNLAAGISSQKLSHDEVTETADKVKVVFTNFIQQVISDIS